MSCFQEIFSYGLVIYIWIITRYGNVFIFILKVIYKTLFIKLFIAPIKDYIWLQSLHLLDL